MCKGLKFLVYGQNIGFGLGKVLGENKLVLERTHSKPIAHAILILNRTQSSWRLGYSSMIMDERASFNSH